MFVSFQVFDQIISVLVLVEVASDVVAVEVVALEVEGRRQFALVVELFIAKNLLALFLHDVPVLGVHEVTFLVHAAALFVDQLAFVVLQEQRLALVVAVEVSQDIVHVEAALLWVTHAGDSLLFLFVGIYHALLRFFMFHDYLFLFDMFRYLFGNALFLLDCHRLPSEYVNGLYFLKTFT